MLTFAFTGPRNLTLQQADSAFSVIYSLPRCCWLIGCANGVDAIARELAPKSYVLSKHRVVGFIITRNAVNA
jgi:hypothetical protein